MASQPGALPALIEWAYYAAYIFGSASTGYMLLRLTYPDVRLIEKHQSMGISFVLGAAIFLLAGGTSLVEGLAFNVQNTLPFFALVYTVLSFTLLKLYFFFNSPSVVTVGVPLHSAAIAAKAFGPIGAAAQQARKETSEDDFSWIKSSATAKKARPSDAKPSDGTNKVDAVKEKFQADRQKERAEKTGTEAIMPRTAKEQDEEENAKPAENLEAGRGKPPQKAAGGEGKLQTEIAITKKGVTPLPAIGGAKTPAQDSGEKAKPAGILSGIGSALGIGASAVEKADEERRRKAEQSKLISDAKKLVTAEEAGNLVELELPIKNERGILEEKIIPRPGETLKDAEMNKIISDVLPTVEGGEGAGRQPQTAQSEARPQVPATPRHRIYAAPPSIRVVASRDATQTDEFEEIVSDVYTQLKSASKEGSLGESVGVNAPPAQKKAAKGAKEAPAKVEMGDLEAELFGKAPAAKAEEETGGSSVFDQLSNINASGGSASAKKAAPIKATSDMEFVHIRGEKGLGCPNCHQNNAKIVFCPYCGSGMCANCSPSVRLEPNGFAYTCPKCGEEVHIAKKSPQPAASLGY